VEKAYASWAVKSLNQKGNHTEKERRAFVLVVKMNSRVFKKV
jgi:hypothetical protein